MTGIEFDPIDGCDSFQAKTVASSRARERPAQFDISEICKRCALHECSSSPRTLFPAIAPIPDVLVCDDFQVSEHFLVDGSAVMVSTGFPILSRRVIGLFVQFKLTGLAKGIAGDFEPLIVKSEVEEAGINPSTLLPSR